MSKRLDRNLRAALRQDPCAFIERCFYELNPGLTFLPHWSIELIAAKLEAVRRGDVRRLIINLPPRSLKSIIASVAFPAFILGHDPTAEIICASYAQDLSEKFSRDTRSIMLSPWYMDCFPNTRLSPNRMAATEFETTMHGFRKATSVGGVVTGRGASFIIIDDPTKPEEAMSRSLRENTNYWFSHTMFSRLNNKQTGRIVVVMQRLSEGDLTDFLKETGEWEVLNLAAIAQHDEEFFYHNGFGMVRVLRKHGEALHPAHESLATLEAIHRNVGTHIFNAQWLQAPTPPEGIMVKQAWFQRYTPATLPEFFQDIIVSVDSANKATELSDYTAITVWGLDNKRAYLLNVLRRKMNYPDLKRTVAETARRFEATRVLVEDRASGTQLIQELPAEGVLCVTGIEPQGDKVMRMNSQTAMIENGFVFIPEDAPWLDEYLHEITAFPNGKHDDQVDSTAQALAWIGNSHRANGWRLFIQEDLERMNIQLGYTVRLRAPEGIQYATTCTGREVSVYGNRIVRVSPYEAQDFVNRGWKKLG